MRPIELIRAKREHLARLANRGGAQGEAQLVFETADWIDRPKGKSMKVLLDALREDGIDIKWSSFDAVALPHGRKVDFSDPSQVRETLADMVFIEIKTASQSRVKPDFSGFFFALTESEIAAAEQLGERHRVALFNRRTGNLMITSVQEIAARARSTNWQVSVQL